MMPIRDPLAILNYECSYCGRLFRLKWQLSDHVRRKHENRTPYICEHCPKAFIKNSDLTAHLRSHSDETPFNCRYCIRAFKSDKGRTIHEDQHGFNTYKCSNCEEVFSSYVKLIRHKIVHKKSIVKRNKMICYECSYCYFIFSTLDFKMKHEVKVHSKSISEKNVGLTAKKQNKSINQFLKFTCPVCLETLKGRSEFVKHAKNFHPGEDIFYQECSLCSKKFTIDYFPLHMMAHNGIKPYACDVCDAKFVRSHELDHHKSIHSDLKLVECPDCHIKLKTVKHLSSHRRYYHSGYEFLECDICGKTYRNKVLLKRHKTRTHYRSENSEKCGFCRRNVAKVNMEKHLRKFHSDEKKLCNICGVTFGNLYFYSIHLQKTCNNKLGSSFNLLNNVTCSYCSYTAISKANLKKHCLSTHINNVFSCIKCPYVSLSEDNYKKHLLFHTKLQTNLEIASECFFCGFITFSYTAFQNHMKSHEYFKWLISWNQLRDQSNEVISGSPTDLYLNPISSFLQNKNRLTEKHNKKRNTLIIKVTKEISWTHHSCDMK